MLAAMADLNEDRHRLLVLAVHELRTPLNVAAGYLKMLLDPRTGTMTDRQAQLATKATDSLGSVARLLTNLNEIAAIESGELALTASRRDLAELAAPVVAGFVPPQDSFVRAVLQVQPGDYPAEVDAERITRALRGCLTALAREVAAGSTLVVSLRSPGSSTATLTLAHEDLVTSLDPAASAWGPADQWRGGLGLELPFARRVIERHGGQLLSPTGPERQPAFLIVLPLAAGGSTVRAR
jgi:two-component system cell cycle sensor histidine kinase PleC